MGNLSNLLKNPTSQVDTVAALVEAVLLDEQASDSNLASNLVGGGVGSVPIQSGPNATTFVASPTTSGHKFLLAWEPSGAAVEPAAIDVTSLGTLAAASSSNPVIDGTAAPGTAITYARGDHVHPTDTSRAKAGANSDITSLAGLTTALSITQGGTGQGTAAAALAALGGAPANPPITTKSATYAAQITDQIILYSGVMDGSQGITLPVSNVPNGKLMTVKVISTNTGGSALNISTSNSAEYAGNPQLFTIPGAAACGGIASFVWDGSAWWLLEYSQ